MATSERSSKPKKEFEFTVDGKPFKTSEPRQTGAAIKATAGVESSMGLFLEGHGRDHSNRAIGDNDVVDLGEPGTEHFYTVPAATFGFVREA